MLPPRIDKDVVQRKIGTYADQSQSLEQRGQIYQELLGFVPPRIEARLNVTGALDPKMIEQKLRRQDRPVDAVRHAADGS
jgi:hypothetical protein